jgi:hypothetical protein
MVGRQETLDAFIDKNLEESKLEMRFSKRYHATPQTVRAMFKEISRDINNEVNRVILKKLGSVNGGKELSEMLRKKISRAYRNVGYMELASLVDVDCKQARYKSGGASGEGKSTTYITIDYKPRRYKTLFEEKGEEKKGELDSLEPDWAYGPEKKLWQRHTPHYSPLYGIPEATPSRMTYMIRRSIHQKKTTKFADRFSRDARSIAMIIESNPKAHWVKIGNMTYMNPSKSDMFTKHMGLSVMVREQYPILVPALSEFFRMNLRKEEIIPHQTF